MQVDTSKCKQILVIPDGAVPDHGDALQAVIDRFPDPRLSLIRPSWLDYRLFRGMKPIGGATTHWLMAVTGITHARCGHVFLHDADAFFLDTNGLERQYAECNDNKLDALGVTAVGSVLHRPRTHDPRNLGIDVLDALGTDAVATLS